jgi:hypothetical protein
MIFLAVVILSGISPSSAGHSCLRGFVAFDVPNLTRHAFSRASYLCFSRREARKPNFKTKINPALIRKIHALRPSQLVSNKSLSPAAALRL